MNRKNSAALQSAYKTAAHEIGGAESEAVRKAAGDIAAKTTVNVGAIWGQIVTTKQAAMEETVASLVEAHLRVGERDETKIAASIRKFIESHHAPGFPGQSDPRELRTIANVRARFDAARASIAARVEDKVNLALLARRSDTTRLREITRWMENNLLGAWTMAVLIGFAALRGLLGFAINDLPKIVSLFTRKTL